MNSPTENIKTILVANTSLVFATDLFIGKEPSSPNNVVTLYDTPDQGPQLFTDKNNKDENDDDDSYLYAGVQARIRNTKYNQGMAEAKKVVKVLHNRGNEVVGTDRVTLIEAVDNPTLLEYDDNDRAIIVVNFVVQQTPQPQN